MATAVPDDRKVGLVQRVSVVGKDQRKLLPRMVETKFREAADSVGLIAHANGFACTAFCVAPDMIATNAHCVANKSARRRPIDLNQAIFRLKPSDKYVRRLFSRLRISDAKQPLASVYTGVMSGNFSRATMHRDWALVKLAEPICTNYWIDVVDAPKSKLGEAARAKKLFLIGYHGDKKMKGKWISNTCALVVGRRAKAFRVSRTVAKRHLLLHTCDATKGASGSPIFMETSSGHAVVGINSGHVSYTTYRRNLNTGKRKLLSSRLANTAVKTSAFIRGLDRFRSEDAVRTADEMRRLQERLRQAGFLKGRADGRFGPQTRRAIRRLEVRRKMAPLGLPTLTLLHELEREAVTQPAVPTPEVREEEKEKAAVTAKPPPEVVPPLPQKVKAEPLAAPKVRKVAPKRSSKRSKKRRVSKVRRRKSACMTFNQCLRRCRAGTLDRDRLHGAYCGHMCSSEIELC